MVGILVLGGASPTAAQRENVLNPRMRARGHDLIVRKARLRRRPDLVDIGIADGRIRRIERRLGAAREIDAGGHLTTPSFVEPHIHLDKALTADRAPENRTNLFEEALAIMREVSASKTTASRSGAGRTWSSSRRRRSRRRIARSCRDATLRRPRGPPGRRARADRRRVSRDPSRTLRANAPLRRGGTP